MPKFVLKIKNKKEKLALFLLATTLLLSSCQQLAEKLQKDGDRVVLHNWVFEIKYFNKKKQKNYSGKTKVYIDSEDRLRMDVFDSFGLVTIGTLVINEGQVMFKMIHGEKYTGSVDSEKIKSLLKIDVNPKNLVSLFKQSGFEGKDWICTVGKNDSVFKKCVNTKHKISINWSGRMTEKGTKISLNHLRAKLDFKVKAYKSYKDYDERLFKF